MKKYEFVSTLAVFLLAVSSGCRPGGKKEERSIPMLVNRIEESVLARDWSAFADFSVNHDIIPLGAQRIAMLPVEGRVVEWELYDYDEVKALDPEMAELISGIKDEAQLLVIKWEFPSSVGPGTMGPGEISQYFPVVKRDGSYFIYFDENSM